MRLSDDPMNDRLNELQPTTLRELGLPSPEVTVTLVDVVDRQPSGTLERFAPAA